MEIKKYLEELGIKFKEFNHPAVFTCEEAEKYNKDIRGIHSKNLFIKNRKSKKFYLIIMPANNKLDMQEFETILKDKVKFANEEDLKNILNLTAGAVSPFGLINDKSNIVKIVIDKEVWNSDFVSFHPNINTKTLELTKENFHKYLKSLKNELIIF
mgnify:CR=1 FL=1